MFLWFIFQQPFYFLHQRFWPSINFSKIISNLLLPSNVSSTKLFFKISKHFHHKFKSFKSFSNTSSNYGTGVFRVASKFTLEFHFSFHCSRSYVELKNQSWKFTFKHAHEKIFLKVTRTNPSIKKWFLSDVFYVLHQFVFTIN